MKEMKKSPLKLKINGQWKQEEAEPGETLLHFLREKLNCTDVKEGCGRGDCGVCAVILSGKAVNACLTIALQAQGQEVVTLRGLGTAERPDPIQKSFVEHGAIQCGFCTSGMVLTAKAFLNENPHPTREEIREAISGNLCRCSGYQKVIEAIEDAAGKSQSQKTPR